MKIGILQADSVRPEFREEFGNYPGMIQLLLESSKVPGLELEFITYNVVELEYPNELSECDGYVITGSAASVYDNEPWINELKQFVVRLHETRTKTIGICFGHQMIALALSGIAEPSDAGWGIGVHESSVVSKKPFMTPKLERFSLLYSHRDQVMTLPKGAELLATHDFCPNAMFVIDAHMFAFQGHPEFVKEYSNTLMNFRRDMVGENKYVEGVASLNRELSSQTIGRWILNFLAV
jgi:GMP synthase-like glutamine amidotransferase